MDDEVVNDIVMTLGVSFVVTVFAAMAIRRLPPEERLVPQLSLVAHLLSAPLLLALMDHVFKVSDAQMYFAVGGDIAHLMRHDFGRWGPEAVKFTLQVDNDLSRYFPERYGGMYSTSSMTGSVGLLMFCLSDAHYAVFALMAGIAYFGKFAAFRGMRRMLPLMDSTTVASAMMLVPSVVFWSSGVVKESWAITGLGIMTLWLSRVSEKTLLSSPHLPVLGIPPILLIKPYLLFPFTLAAGVWFMLTRERRTHTSIKPMYLLAATAAVVSLMLVLSAYFPAFSLSELGTSTASVQRHGEAAEGGSSYSLGNAQSTTLTGQLAFAPIAITTALVRPFFFEVRNFTMALASAESTLILILLFRLFRKNSFGSVFGLIRKSPPLAYCFVFTAISGLAIGLASSNFGTLSRYRIPMMPYYVLLVLVLIDKKNGVAAIMPPELARARRSTRERRPGDNQPPTLATTSSASLIPSPVRRMLTTSSRA